MTKDLGLMPYRSSSRSPLLRWQPWGARKSFAYSDMYLSHVHDQLDLHGASVNVTLPLANPLIAVDGDFPDDSG